MANVYFTKTITPEAVVRMYEVLNKELTGKIAVKVHSGEQGNQNFLRPAFLQPMIEHVRGTVVECNTAYGGARNSTEKHRKLFDAHGWTALFDVDLMDAEGLDAVFPIPDGKAIRENFVGKNLLHYDSMLVLSHFKGHPMGGFGGALKQLSIGCASSEGKAYIHSAGVTKDQSIVWDNCAEQNTFLEAMADAAGSVVRHFAGNMAFVSILCNLSVDCDCCEIAEDPCMRDIGILSSLDPVALDTACMDRIYAATDDPGRQHFLNRVNRQNGTHILDAAEALGYGSKQYTLIEIEA